MFQRFTESARRVIFFARYEASQYGSPSIETEHLLLGLLREDRVLTRLVLPTSSIEGIRREIELGIEQRERISTSVEVPLTSECKRILNFAVEEADQLQSTYIGTEHLLLGVLRESSCLAARILAGHGVTLEDARAKAASHSVGPGLQWGIAKRVPIGAAVDDFIEGCGSRDTKRIAGLFVEHGQLWDAQGELWLGPAQVQKGLDAHFGSSDVDAVVPNIKDMKFVTSEVFVATLVWERQAEAKTQNKGRLRMVLVLYEAHAGWLVASAHLAWLQPGVLEDAPSRSPGRSNEPA